LGSGRSRGRALLLLRLRGRRRRRHELLQEKLGAEDYDGHHQEDEEKVTLVSGFLLRAFIFGHFSILESGGDSRPRLSRNRLARRRLRRSLALAPDRSLRARRDGNATRARLPGLIRETLRGVRWPRLRNRNKLEHSGKPGEGTARAPTCIRAARSGATSLGSES